MAKKTKPLTKKTSRSAAKSRPKLKAAAMAKALAKVKVLILDIDGVMTDGRIFWSNDIGWGAMYSVIDGFGIRTLMKAGVEVCVISGGNFVSHKKRAEVLKIQHAYFGDEDKIHAYEKILRDLKVTDADCAYIGDELFDIPVLQRVAFAATPPHAPEAVKKSVHYVTKKQGGFGCVRELTDAILAAREAHLKVRP
jgi:3-deoxy-D-manno-octulosonate 8-phosphate phosphatase (KDO 8-P phosphatase)